MDEVYISQWDALNCLEDWEDSRGRFHWAHEDVTYQAIEKLPPADVIPIERILKQDGGPIWFSGGRKRRSDWRLATAFTMGDRYEKENRNPI